MTDGENSRRPIRVVVTPMPFENAQMLVPMTMSVTFSATTPANNRTMRMPTTMVQYATPVM